MELMVLVCITLAKSVSANWHQSTTSVDGMEHLEISRDDSGVAAIEAPLQVRGGASGRSASSLERGWQAVTDANATAKCSLLVATPRHPNSTPCRVVALLLRVEASDVYIVPPSPRCVARGASPSIHLARLGLCVITVK